MEVKQVHLAVAKTLSFPNLVVDMGLPIGFLHTPQLIGYQNHTLNFFKPSTTTVFAGASWGPHLPGENQRDPRNATASAWLMQPSSKRLQKTIWKDPLFCSWENSRFFYRHGFNSYVANYQMVYRSLPTCQPFWGAFAWPFSH